MAFNQKRFLEALIGVATPSTPTTPVAMDFAQYMAANPWGGANLQTDAAVIAKKAEDESREPGALAKTFGYLMSAGNLVQNTMLDAMEMRESQDSGDPQSFGSFLGDVGKNVAAFGAHTVQPALEIAAIPGVEAPFGLEPDAASEFISKHGTQHHGTGHISGQRLLEEGGLAPENKLGKAGLGFGIDIATDPLSYMGVGLPVKAIAAKLGIKRGAKETLEEAAAKAEPLITPEARVAETVNELPNSVAAPQAQSFKPAIQTPIPSALAKPQVQLPAIDPVAGILPKGALAEPNIATRPTNEWGLSPADMLNIKTNLVGLTPEAKRTAQAVKANEVKLYEKLRPVDVPDKLPPTLAKRYGAEHAFGEQMVDEGYITFDAPRPLTRDDARQIYDDMMDIASSEKAIRTDFQSKKQALLAAENALIKQGYTFPEGRFSSWLQKEGPKGDLDAFTKGKPLKTRPLISEDVGLVTERYGDQFVKSKGITPELVANTVKNLGREVAEGAAPTIPIRPVTGKLKPVAIETAERVRSGWGKNGKLANYNPVNQTNMYNAMWNAVQKSIGGDIKLSQRQMREAALSMTREAEDYLLKTHGLRPMHWDGTGLRLTSVLAELGPQATKKEFITKILDAFRTKDLAKITDPETKAVLVQAMARRHVEMGAVAKAAFEGFKSTDEIMKETVSFQKYMKWLRGDAIPKLKADAIAAGASTKEATAIANVAKNSVDSKNVVFSEPMRVLDTAPAKAVQEAVETGKPIRVHEMNEAIIRAAGDTPSTIRKDYLGSKVADTVATRLFTWYGMGDMHSVALTRAQAAESIAKKRAELFGNMKANFTVEEQAAAFYHAQNFYQGVVNPDPRIAKLGEQMLDYFENILGSRSSFANLKTSAFPDMAGSLATRAAFTMDDLNRHLKAVGAYFQFTEKGYPKGQWMRSWDTMDPLKLKQDPASFLYDLDLAAMRLATEYSVIDDFAMRFGTRGATEGTRLSHHRVPDDVRFDPKTAHEFENLMKQMKEGAWRPESDFGKMYVKGLRIWKTGMTIYAPSHHIRNLIGDSWLMWVAGHNDPRMFSMSKKILHSQRARYAEAMQSDSFDALRGLVSKDEQAWARTQGADVILKKRGVNITADELYGEAMQTGLLLDASRAEDIIGEPLFASLPGKNPSALRKFAQKPLGGMAHKTATGVAEYREHFVRMAHFTSAVNKKITPQIAAKLRKAGPDPVARREVLRNIYDEAAQEVRKWHPDGRDLTRFEQKWMRNIIPFYSWQRKAIPLIIEAMVTRPSKITMYPRATYAAQTALGIEAPGPSDPFPTDQLFPDWMRAGGIGPIGDSQSDNAVAKFLGNLGRNMVLPTGGEKGYTVINPGNPFNDTITQFGGMGSAQSTLKGVGSSLTPAFNVPKEALSDKKFTGAPISKDAGGEGYLPWATEQVPIATILQRIFEVGEEHQEGTETGPNREAILNLLSGLGIKGSGQYIKSAEFDAKRAAKKLLEK